MLSVPLFKCLKCTYYYYLQFRLQDSLLMEAVRFRFSLDDNWAHRSLLLKRREPLAILRWPLTLLQPSYQLLIIDICVSLRRNTRANAKNRSKTRVKLERRVLKRIQNVRISRKYREAALNDVSKMFLKHEKHAISVLADSYFAVCEFFAWNRLATINLTYATSPNLRISDTL